MKLLQAYETRREELSRELNFFRTLEKATKEQYHIMNNLMDLPEPTEETLTYKVGSTIYDLFHLRDNIELIQLKDDFDSGWCNDDFYQN